MSSGESPAVAAARGIPPATLLAYVTGRRWFGAKGAAPTAVRIAHATPLPWEGGAFALLRLDVDTNGGKVALKGTAPNAEARDRAAKLARSVSGVTDVDNQLAIKG